MTNKLLVISSNDKIAHQLEETAAQGLYKTEVVPTVEQAIALLSEKTFEAIIINLFGEQKERNLEELKNLRQAFPKMPMFLIADQGDLRDDQVREACKFCENLTPAQLEQRMQNKTLQDVIQRNKLILELLETEARFHKVAKTIQDGLVIVENGEVKYSNQRMAEITGYSLEEMHQSSPSQHVAPEERHKMKRFWDAYRKQANPQATSITCWIERKDGERRFVLLRYSEPTGNPESLSYIVTVTDITEQIFASKALSQSDARYQAVVETQTDLINRILLDGTITFINDAYCRYFGKSRAELVGSKITPLAVEEDRALALEKLREINPDNPTSVAEIRMINADGETRWVEWTDTGIFDDSGNLIEIQGVGKDITRRKQVEDALIQSEAFNRGLVENAPLGILYVDAEQRITYENPTLKRMMGVPEGSDFSMEGKMLSDLPFGEEIEIGEYFQELSAGKPIIGKLIHYKSLMGVESELRVYASPIFTPQGDFDGAIILLVDISEQIHSRQAMERQLSELKVLHAIAQASVDALSEDELIEHVTEIMGETIYSDNFGILLYDERTKNLSPHYSYRGIPEEALSFVISLGEGIAGKVAETGKPWCIGDTKEEAAFLKVVSNMHSELAVPVIAGDQLIGVINAESTQKDFFSEEDVRLMSTLAGTVASAINRLRAEEAEREQRTLAEVLRDTAAILNSTLDSGTILSKILDLVDRVIPIETATIFRVVGDEAIVVGNRGFKKYGIKAMVDTLHISLEEGTVLGDTVRSGKPLIVSDTSKDERWTRFKGLEWINSVVGIPIKQGGVVIGILTIDSSIPGFFNEKHAKRLEAFADQVGIALNNADLYQRALQDAERQIALHKMSQEVIAAGGDPESVYYSVHEATKKIMPCEAFAITLVNEAQDSIQLVYGYDRSKRAAEMTLPIGKGFAGYVIRTGRSMRIDNTQQIGPEIQTQHFGDPEPVRSLIIAPLMLNQRVIGTISSQSYQLNAFTDEDLRILEMLAAYTAVAIENARLYQEALKAADRNATVYKVSQEIVLASSEPDKIAEAIHYAVDILMPTEVFVIILVGENEHEAQAIYIYDQGKLYPPQTFPMEDSLTSQVITTRKPVLINQADEPVGFQIGKGEPVTSILAVPLKLQGGRIIGMMSTQSYQSNAYGDEELHLLEMLAAMAAIALENARLLDEVRRHANNLAAQNEITQDVLQGEDLQSTLEVLAERITKLLGADSCGIALWDEETQRVIPTTAFGAKKDTYVNLTFKEGEISIAEEVVKAKRALIIEDVNNSQLVSKRIMEIFDVKSILGLPLITQNQSLGAALVVYENPHQFNPEEINLGEQAAAQVSLALAKLRLLDDVRRRAHEFEVLYQVAADISIEQDLQTMLEKIVDEVLMLLETQHGGIYLYNADSNDLELKIAKSMDISIGTKLIIGEGMAGKVAQTRQPLVVRNYQSWEGRSEKYEGVPFTSVLEVPMIYQGGLIGVLVVNEVTPKLRDFSDRDIRLLSLFASQVAGAIHSSRLFEETKKRLRELEAITNVSTAMRSAATYSDIPPVILKQILGLLNAHSAVLLSYDSQTDEGVITDIQGEWGMKGGDRFALDHPILREMITSQEIQLFEDISIVVKKIFGRNHQKNISAISIPLIAQKEILGVIVVFRRCTEGSGNAFSGAEMRILSAIASISANALRRAELHEQTQMHLKRLTVLNEIEMTVSSSFDLHLTFEILLDRLTTQLEADAADILLYNPTAQRLSYETGKGFNSRQAPMIDYRLDEGYAGMAALERRIVSLTEDEMDGDYFKQRGLLHEGFVAYDALPLIAKGQIEGVLEIFYRKAIPYDPTWRNFLQTLATQIAVAIDNTNLFNDSRRSSINLGLAYDATIKGWSDALELRDMETEGHSQRVTKATLRLAVAMGIPEEQLPHLRRGALLHDIGKMAVPDSILRKPGKLTAEEWKIMHQHPVYAYQLLAKIEYLKPALDIPHYHHEKWDGSGYPQGLKGAQIPLAARIFAVIDVWDALLSDRPYRKAWKPEKVIEHIKEQSGKHFDPDVVNAFLDLLEKGEI